MLLKRGYSFWLQSGKADRQNFDDHLVHIDSFNTVQKFWHLYQYMCRPYQIVEGGQVFLFQEGIKPLWEDTANEGGGRFLYRVKNKSHIDRIWEDLVLNYIGEQCPLNELITGLIVHQKKNFILISIWIRQTPNKDQIEQWLQDVLGIHDKSTLEYQDHPKNTEQQQQQQT